MQMAGTQRIAASRQGVWEALNNPDVLRQCIPGCQSLEMESADRMNGTVEIKIGPIGARFKGAVQLSDLDPPNGYTITGEGQGGTVGSAKGGAKVQLADDAGFTLLSYEVNAQVGGRLAQLGGPIIDATAKQLAGKFFKKFGEVVGAPAVSTAPGASAEALQGAPAALPIQSGVLPGVSPVPGAARSQGLPMAWILAVVVSMLVGFLVGRGQGGIGTGSGAGSDWAGLAIGLLLVIVAAAGFEFGRRTASPVVMLDPVSLARLLGGDRR